MRLLDAENAADYLRESRHIARDEPVRVSELTGGVSNMVLLVEREVTAGDAFVLKQARAQLRTRQPWFSSVERIWREVDTLTICARLLHANTNDTSADLTALTPEILFEDRENCLFAMTAAPRPNVVWKAELLAGRTDPRIAAACGHLLGTLHGASWRDPQIEAQLGDRTHFEQLRVDPYYRTLAETRPEAREAIHALIESLSLHPRSLVHADFSPKNLLVSATGLMMVDFETGHYGDPAFDLGFFLSHLVLKACYHRPRHQAFLDLADRFWQSYAPAMSTRISSDEWEGLQRRGLQNLAGCAWARLDGKSPVEYLSAADARERVRQACRELFAAQPDDWPQARAIIERHFD